MKAGLLALFSLITFTSFGQNEDSNSNYYGNWPNEKQKPGNYVSDVFDTLGLGSQADCSFFQLLIVNEGIIVGFRRLDSLHYSATLYVYIWEYIQDKPNRKGRLFIDSVHYPDSLATRLYLNWFLGKEDSLLIENTPTLVTDGISYEVSFVSGEHCQCRRYHQGQYLEKISDSDLLPYEIAIKETLRALTTKENYIKFRSTLGPGTFINGGFGIMVIMPREKKKRKFWR